MDKILITIFTPTYNRADLLPRLYKSLCEQKIDFDSDGDENPVFEWLIVDDGSTDNTEEIVHGFIAEQSLPIRYYKKSNGGKHTAINYGAKLAKGELFFIADSDDLLPNNAVENVISAYSDIRNNKRICGVCGLDSFMNGNLVSPPFPYEIFEASFLEIDYKYKIKGDTKEVFRTSVLLEFPFPEIQGEKFCPEILVWYRILSKYRLCYINKVIYIADYQPGGLTDGITRARMNSPIASMMTYQERFQLPIPLKDKAKAAINYWRFAFCTKDKSVTINGWGKLFAPLGFLMHLLDEKKLK